MEKIVYFLGAGFSAPLGLPVSSNFLLKSKDQYFEHQDDYSYFAEIIKEISRLSTIKNVFNADLFNIEEILSILEMSSHLEDRKLTESFKNYICDVIKYHTPTIKKYENGQLTLPGNWENFLFGHDTLHRSYGYFVGNLLNLIITRNASNDTFTSTYNSNNNIKYSIITLNYDLVLENFTNFLKVNFSGNKIFSIPTSFTQLDWNKGPYIAKLHGSIDSRDIIPPTWNKGFHSEIMFCWKLAHQLLIEANQLRIIGYSLPETDAYVKYLLKAAIIQSPHLKKIDVLCLDHDKTVKERYDRFVSLPHSYYRFLDGSVINYLDNNYSKNKKNPHNVLSFNKLEEAHLDFFERYSI